MDTQQWLVIFVAVTAAAVVVQMIVLVVFAVSAMSTAKRLRALADQVETKGLPLVDNAKQTLGSTQETLGNVRQTLSSAQQILTSIQAAFDESKPKIQQGLKNLTDGTAVIKSRIEKIDKECEPLIDRVKTQATRINSVVTETVDRVETVSEIFERSVKVPASRASGIVQGIRAGIQAFGKRPPNSGRPKQKDEMFI
jgi:ABC-type transporter Mla subunit MlaD